MESLFRAVKRTKSSASNDNNEPPPLPTPVSPSRSSSLNYSSTNYGVPEQDYTPYPRFDKSSMSSTASSSRSKSTGPARELPPVIFSNSPRIKDITSPVNLIPKVLPGKSDVRIEGSNGIRVRRDSSSTARSSVNSRTEMSRAPSPDRVSIRSVTSSNGAGVVGGGGGGWETSSVNGRHSPYQAYQPMPTSNSPQRPGNTRLKSSSASIMSTSNAVPRPNTNRNSTASALSAYASIVPPAPPPAEVVNRLFEEFLAKGEYSDAAEATMREFDINKKWHMLSAQVTGGTTKATQDGHPEIYLSELKAGVMSVQALASLNVALRSYEIECVVFRISLLSCSLTMFVQ
jgi:hypothetical protein